MLLRLINYGIRIAIIVVGILLVSGAIPLKNTDDSFIKPMGYLFIIFGVYRIVTYYLSLRRISKEESNETEN